MHLLRVLIALIAFVLAQPVLAQGGPPPGGGRGGSPIDALQEDIDTLNADLAALAGRVTALESNDAVQDGQIANLENADFQGQINSLDGRVVALESSDVAGRSYCRTLINTSFRGDQDPSSFPVPLDTRNQLFFLRQIFDFAGDDTFIATGVSTTLMRVDNTGAMLSLDLPPRSGSGSYSQSGRIVTLMFDAGGGFSLNVGSDGSVMLNQNPNSFAAGPVFALASGDNTFVQIDSPLECPALVAPPTS